MNTTPHSAPGRRTRDGRLDGGEGARRERREERILGYALLALVFVSHAAILMQHPVVGAAENGDFSRVTGPAGIVSLDPYEAVDHKYVSQIYGVAPTRLGTLFSSAAVIAAGAKLLGVGAATLDIRQVGCAYLVLFAAAFAQALWAGVPALLCALLAWAALDVSYSLYLNSFFADGAALLGFLGIVLGLLAWDGATGDRGRRRLSGALLVLAALIAAFSKHLYMLTPFLAAIAVVAWPSRAWTAQVRGAALLLLALGLGGLLAVWHFTLGGGERFPEANRHHAVFSGLVRVADDPAEVLVELGIDPRSAALAGTNFFRLSEEDRRLSTDALRDVSSSRLALAYLRDPHRVERALAQTLPCLRLTTTADPNFSDRTRPPAFYRGWWQFAQLRGPLYPVALALLIAGLLGLARAAFLRTWRGAHAALAFLLLNAVVLVIAGVLGDGLLTLHRHLIGARFSLDLGLALVAYAIYRRLRALIHE